MIRTHDAGALRPEHVSQTVTLAGWVVRDEEVAHSLRSEFCLRVTGQVGARPEGNANPAIPTGEIEVVALPGVEGVEVLSPSAPLPFPIDDAASHKGGDVGEEVRLAHRYLDLRRSGPAAAIRLRSRLNKAARAVLDRHDFVEVEPPTLTRSTPEGCARLPRARPPAARHLVCAAPEPAAVQAAADGRRPRALLPDRPLLPR